MRIFRLFWTLALASLLLLSAACSQKSEQHTIAAKAQGKPALWKVTGKNGSAYLTERNRDLKEYSDLLRSANIPAPQLLAKLQLVELHRELLKLRISSVEHPMQ